MTSYGPLAPWYDKLTKDVPYASFADFYEKQFQATEGSFQMLLDLCCGTGTLTQLMAQRGYEMIAVDMSPDMLMSASAKDYSGVIPPLFLCQDARELDLYGTVDACYCSLDGFNYIPGEDLPEVFRRLHLFVRPGGLLVFDLRTEDFFASIDGDIFVDETEDVLCLWRADYEPEEKLMVYSMDVFSRSGKYWKRGSEDHLEYVHPEEELRKMLASNGFINIKFTTDCPQGNMGRVFVIAQRNE
ncbi:MAG: class I SAM-dependent methyltransferase [Oscillospiraceae bacterium]|nr:class I SAM-dependent methyltransferase [Oscillospiraceae bacterium]